MACEVKEQLLATYRAATQSFAAAVAELHAKIGKSSLIEYQRLQRMTEEARLKSEQARLAFEQHVAFHQC